MKIANEDEFVRAYMKARKCSLGKARKKYRFGVNLSRVIENYVPEYVSKYAPGGAKFAEIGPQVQSIVSGFYEGYGLGGVGGWTEFAWKNGKLEVLRTVPLSKLILWHPVRGEGVERAEAGPKTTERANAVGDAIHAQRVTYTQDNPLTYEQIDSIPGMRSNDPIVICPVNTISRTMLETPDVQRRILEISILSDDIASIESSLSESIEIREDDIEEMQREIDRLSSERNKKLRALQSVLFREYDQSFLVLSGQGRAQAIIEATRATGVSPDEFFMSLRCRDVHLDICNVLIKIHNDYVRSGKFRDESHNVYVNGRYVPMEEIPLAFSCARGRLINDTACFTRFNHDTSSPYTSKLKCSDIYHYEVPLSKWLTKS
jgi:hypothetical protein